MEASVLGESAANGQNSDRVEAGCIYIFAWIRGPDFVIMSLSYLSFSFLSKKSCFSLLIHFITYSTNMHSWLTQDPYFLGDELNWHVGWKRE